MEVKHEDTLNSDTSQSAHPMRCLRKHVSGELISLCGRNNNNNKGCYASLRRPDGLPERVHIY
jgi:hypothetical protein